MADAITMKAEDRAAKEQELVRLYMDLTGANEPTARGVFMYVCCPAEAQNDGALNTDLSAWQQREPLGNAVVSGSEQVAYNGRKHNGRSSVRKAESVRATFSPSPVPSP